MHPARELPLEEATARSLLLLADDPRVLYCLPVMLDGCADDELQVELLKSRARELHVEAALGMVLELTAELSGSAQFRAWAGDLRPLAGAPEYLTLSTSERYRAFTDGRTPPVVERWGFRVNAPMDDLKAFFKKHTAGRHG